MKRGMDGQRMILVTSICENCKEEMDGAFKVSRIFFDDEELKAFCGNSCFEEFRKKSTYNAKDTKWVGRGRR